MNDSSSSSRETQGFEDEDENEDDWFRANPAGKLFPALSISGKRLAIVKELLHSEEGTGGDGAR
jgi:hypothetical protein